MATECTDPNDDAAPPNAAGCCSGSAVEAECWEADRKPPPLGIPLGAELPLALGMRIAAVEEAPADDKGRGGGAAAR